MAKAVILKTDTGIYLLGAMQCSNGAWFDAEGCFKYCHQEGTDFWNKLQADKLKCTATQIGRDKFSEDWYKHRENFIDIDVPFECTQNYIHKRNEEVVV